MHNDGWDAWVRTLVPDEIPGIRDDLCAIRDDDVRAFVKRGPASRSTHEELSYVLHHLHGAQEFVTALCPIGAEWST